MIDEDKQEASIEPTSQEPQAPQAEAAKQEPEQQESTLPDKFKGKSAEEIAKSYTEAEKELGRLRNKAGEAESFKKELEEWRQLGNWIKSDPERLKTVQSWAETQTENQPKRDDTKVALEQNIINGFERRYGIDTLPGEQRATLHQRIGDELAEMLDPGGTKTYEQILEEVPVSKLDKFLDKAYKLATVDDAAERSRLQGVLEARQNNEAAVGNIPSSSGKSEDIILTEEERRAARRMNVSEKDYAEAKKKIAEGK